MTKSVSVMPSGPNILSFRNASYGLPEAISTMRLSVSKPALTL